MGISDKMWDAITTVIKMNDKVERMAAAMKGQQEKIELAQGRKAQRLLPYENLIRRITPSAHPP